MRKIVTACAVIALAAGPVSADVGPGFNSNGAASSVVWWGFDWCQVTSHFGIRYRPCWRV